MPNVTLTNSLSVYDILYKAFNLGDQTAIADLSDMIGSGGFNGAPQGYISQQYYGPTGAATALKTATADTLFAVPYFVRNTQAFDQIAAEVTTAGTGSTVVRLGIWEHDGALTRGSLGQLVVDAGAASGLAAAGITRTLTGVTLRPGWYWLGAAAQTVTGAPVLRGFTGGGTLPTTIGPASGTSMNVTNSYSIASVAGAFAAFTSGTPTAQTTAPSIVLRAT